MKKQGPFHPGYHKPNWGVLAPDPANLTFHKPDNFLSQIRALSQPGGVAPGSTTQPPVLVKGSGKHGSIHLSKDIPL
ncbi:MAG TPA: hypothetical protein VGK00_06915 [Anaerolineales bacterium]